MSKPTIAVVMITKNEEVMLPRSMDSVKDADAIYICDTGSIDNTVEVAKKYTKNVCIDYVWNDDFAKAQNHAKSHVKEDWILSLDADEFVQDFSEVRKAVEEADKQGQNAVAVQMIAEGGSTYNFKFARLFKNSPEIFWVQPIHKHLNIPGSGAHIGDVKITFGWSPAHRLDPDRALRILEKTVKEEDEAAAKGLGSPPVRNLYYLGREYWYKERYKEATATLGRYVQVGYWDAEKAESFLIMSQSYSRQGLDEDARDACLQAIKINPNFKEAIEWMASISTPANVSQWKQMAKTADNRDLLFTRTEIEFPNARTIFLSPHNDDECLFGAYTLMRLKPLVIVCTDSYIQPNRGDIGCDAETRRNETIKAMDLLGCPVVFLGIKDTELTEQNLRERLKHFHADTVYAPAIQGGNAQHDIVGKVAQELFGKNVEQYTTYTKTDLYTTSNWEVKPTEREMDLKNQALDQYVSQINLPSTAPHFLAVRNKSEWLK